MHKLLFITLFLISSNVYCQNTQGQINSAPRITWENGKYMLTTNNQDVGLYFKYGSIVGIYSGEGENATHQRNSNNSIFIANRDIAWAPIEITKWEQIPTGKGSLRADKAYHTISNVKKGKGDPCRLVGLDLNKIKNTHDSYLTEDDIDNKKWRLPSNAENIAFTGITNHTPTGEYSTSNQNINGYYFPKPNTQDGIFVPANGYRDYSNGIIHHQGRNGTYLSATGINQNSSYIIFFSVNNVRTQYSIDHRQASGVRCVPQ